LVFIAKLKGNLVRI